MRLPNGVAAEATRGTPPRAIVEARSALSARVMVRRRSGRQSLPATQQFPRRRLKLCMTDPRIVGRAVAADQRCCVRSLSTRLQLAYTFMFDSRRRLATGNVHHPEVAETNP